MNDANIEEITSSEYKEEFETKIEEYTVPLGLNEEVIKFISSKKNEPQWMLDLRLKAFKLWKKQKEPKWAKLNYTPVDYQKISYYSTPKKSIESLDELDPEILKLKKCLIKTNPIFPTIFRHIH